MDPNGARGDRVKHAPSEPTRNMITVNQRDRIAWYSDMTVEDLLEQCRYTFPQITVIINGNIVPHDLYQETHIPDGADVRVIHLMAGG